MSKKTEGKQAKTLDSFAKDVWTEPTLQGKRDKLLIMLDNCRFQSNLGKFLPTINSPDVSPTELDKIAANLTLCDTMRVIK